MSYQFIESFKVRDYECDLQGIVNNAVYQSYFEHARHEFLLSRGADFAAYAKDGINLVVVRAEIDFKKSLHSGDKFYVGLNFSMKDNVRFQFHQTLHLASDDSICTQGVIIGTGITSTGRPRVPTSLIDRLSA